MVITWCVEISSVAAVLRDIGIAQAADGCLTSRFQAVITALE